MGVMVAGRVRRSGVGEVLRWGWRWRKGTGGEERGRKMSGGEIEGDRRDRMGVR